MSSNTCCATALDGLVPCWPVGSGAFITPCTRASCTIRSSKPSCPCEVIVCALRPRPSQMQRTSLPEMIWASRPVSTWRISMNRLSKRRTYGWCNATRSAVPSHSIVPADLLGSPCLLTYRPNSGGNATVRMH